MQTINHFTINSTFQLNNNDYFHDDQFIQFNNSHDNYITSVHFVLKPIENQSLFYNIPNDNAIGINCKIGSDSRTLYYNVPKGTYTVETLFSMINEISISVDIGLPYEIFCNVKVSGADYSKSSLELELPENVSVSFERAIDVLEILGFSKSKTIFYSGTYVSDASVDITHSLEVISVYSNILKASSCSVHNNRSDLLANLKVNSPFETIDYFAENLMIPVNNFIDNIDFTFRNISNEEILLSANVLCTLSISSIDFDNKNYTLDTLEPNVINHQKTMLLNNYYEIVSTINNPTETITLPEPISLPKNSYISSVQILMKGNTFNITKENIVNIDGQTIFVSPGSYNASELLSILNTNTSGAYFSIDNLSFKTIIENYSEINFNSAQELKGVLGITDNLIKKASTNEEVEFIKGVNDVVNFNGTNYSIISGHATNEQAYNNFLLRAKETCSGFSVLENSDHYAIYSTETLTIDSSNSTIINTYFFKDIAYSGSSMDADTFYLDPCEVTFSLYKGKASSGITDPTPIEIVSSTVSGLFTPIDFLNELARIANTKKTTSGTFSVDTSNRLRLNNYNVEYVYKVKLKNLVTSVLIDIIYDCGPYSNFYYTLKRIYKTEIVKTGYRKLLEDQNIKYIVNYRSLALTNAPVVSGGDDVPPEITIYRIGSSAETITSSSYQMKTGYPTINAIAEELYSHISDIYDMTIARSIATFTKKKDSLFQVYFSDAHYNKILNHLHLPIEGQQSDIFRLYEDNSDGIATYGDLRFPESNIRITFKYKENDNTFTETRDYVIPSKTNNETLYDYCTRVFTVVNNDFLESGLSSVKTTIHCRKSPLGAYIFSYIMPDSHLFDINEPFVISTTDSGVQFLDLIKTSGVSIKHNIRNYVYFKEGLSSRTTHRTIPKGIYDYKSYANEVYTAVMNPEPSRANNMKVIHDSNNFIIYTENVSSDSAFVLTNWTSANNAGSTLLFGHVEQDTSSILTNTFTKIFISETPYKRITEGDVSFNIDTTIYTLHFENTIYSPEYIVDKFNAFFADNQLNIFFEGQGGYYNAVSYWTINVNDPDNILNRLGISLLENHVLSMKTPMYLYFSETQGESEIYESDNPFNITNNHEMCEYSLNIVQGINNCRLLLQPISSLTQNYFRANCMIPVVSEFSQLQWTLRTITGEPYNFNGTTVISIVLSVLN